MFKNSLTTLSSSYPILTQDYERVRIVLNERRLLHSLGVLEASRILQSRFGGNLLSICRAAVYHDLFKGLKKNELFELGRRVGYVAEGVLAYMPEIAHGPIAALWLEKEGILTDQTALNAIRYHTVGRSEMTLEEKIVYLADAIESGRHYPGIERLRQEAEVSLEGALLISVTQTLSYVLANDRLIHPQSVEMRNALLQLLAK
ncbi:MAG: bis(5'-nucleosyl)-tetraphosphatase (symmetrical) YqeK [Erysipelotrichaceae bacterium]|nr:bis(5'-nucleosyl)-tetraphosphatase (symmetrical) YqeK [Erysipelotrichaceae bacterium]